MLNLSNMLNLMYAGLMLVFQVACNSWLARFVTKKHLLESPSLHLNVAGGFFRQTFGS